MDLAKKLTNLSEEETELLEAIESGDLEQVQHLAHEYWDQNGKNVSFNYILLVAALQTEHKPVIMYFIEEHCPVVKVTHKTGLYCTPLYYAIKMGDLQIAEALSKRGASFFDKDANNVTALELAMRVGKVALIRLALKNIQISKDQSDLDPRCNNGISLFHAACWIGDSETIERFICHQFSLESRSVFDYEIWKGFTALHFAAGNPFRHSGIEQFLKHGNVNPICKDEQGRTFIHLAMRNRYKNTLFKTDIIRRKILRLPVDRWILNPEDKNGLSHFHIFCSMESSEMDSMKQHKYLIQHFIRWGVDVNSSVSLEDEDFPGFTSLHFAAKGRSLEVIELLLKNGADPKKSDKHGVTPLHLICESRINMDHLKILLQHGADPFAKDSQSRTPLHTAFHARETVVALDESEKLLLSKCFDGVNHTDRYGLSYLHIACTGDDLEMVQNLVANGASINYRVHDDAPINARHGYSALHFAVECRQFEIIKYLVANGADVNCSASGGITPLHVACYNRCKYRSEKEIDRICDGAGTSSAILEAQIVEFLIKYGGNVNIEDFGGNSALLKSASIDHITDSPSYSRKQKDYMLYELSGKQKQIFNILLNHGANINAQCDRTGSILHILIRNLNRCPLNIDLIKLALDRGVDVNAVDTQRGMTPLHLAVDSQFSDAESLISLLLEHGADINAKSKELSTPLHVLILRHHHSEANKKIFLKLLSHPDIDIDAQNVNGATPLILAVSRRSDFHVEKLLNYCADINVEDNHSRSALYYLRKSLWGILNICDTNSILTNIVIYAKKLMALKRFISENVLHNFDDLSGHLSENLLHSMDSEVSRELEYLKSHQLDSYTSLYDILFKDPTAMTKHIRNDHLQAVIESINSGTDFTLFGCFIKKKYDEAIKRYKILEPAKIALNFVSNFDWPHACSEEILSYLSDEHLRQLIESSSIEQMRKRLADGLPPNEDSSVKVLKLDQ